MVDSEEVGFEIMLERVEGEIESLKDRRDR